MLVGMVVANPDATLLTACQLGYGKRTPIGPNSPLAPADDAAAEVADDAEVETAEPETDAGEEGDEATAARYPTKNRGTMGVRDIKTTERNGPVIGITVITDDDEIMMMTARGKIQRIRAADISVIGRNTQGVRIMSLDEGDTLAAIVRVPPEEEAAEAAEAAALESSTTIPPPPLPADEADEADETASDEE
jgi:DNA gyrase subunit A